MAGDDLKLLGMWASPFVLRVKLALSLKGLSYEYVEEDLRNKSELLLKSNPVHKKVPVLIHNGKPVSESLIILQYIDEAFAGTSPSLNPADPYERAVARFWASYIDDKCADAGRLEPGVKGQDGGGEVRGERAIFRRGGDPGGRAEGLRQREALFGGDSAGYVDVVLGGLLGWLRANEELQGVKSFNPERSPLLAAWLGRFGALEAVESVVPDVSRLVEFGKMLQARQAAATAAAASASN